MVLPDQDWALPYGAVLGMDKEPSFSSELVVQVQGADKGARLQKLRPMERTAESAVEGGVEGDGEREEAVCDRGPPCRRQVQQGSTGLPIHHGGRGWFRPRLRRMRRVRCQSGNSGSRENERRRGGQKLRGWAPRSRNPCSSPRPPLWHPRKRSENVFPSYLSFVISLVRLLSSWDRPRSKSCNVPPSRGQRRGKRSKMYAAIV